MDGHCEADERVLRLCQRSWILLVCAMVGWPYMVLVLDTFLMFGLQIQLQNNAVFIRFRWNLRKRKRPWGVARVYCYDNCSTRTIQFCNVCEKSSGQTNDFSPFVETEVYRVWPYPEPAGSRSHAYVPCLRFIFIVSFHLCLSKSEAPYNNVLR